MTKPFPVSGYLLFLLAAVFITYLPGLYAPFLFDDFPNIVLNEALHPSSISEITNVLHSPFSGNRPVALASLAANYLFSGLSASSYRLTNIAIHATNALLVFTISFLLLRTKLSASRSHLLLVAFWAAMLWAMNPIQTQAVTYIVQRMTSLATLFYLLAILTYILIRLDKIKLVPGSLLLLVFFFLGILSKQIVASLPAALLLIEFLFFRRTLRPTRIDLAVLGGLFVAAILYFHHIFPSFQWSETYPGRNFSPLERLLTQPRVITNYLSLLIYPEISRLHLDYDISPSRGLLNPPATLFSLLLLLALFLAALLLAKRFVFVSLGILFFFIGNAIEGSFIPLEMAFIHRAYLPSIFIYLALLAYIPEKKYRLFSPLILLLFAFFSLTTYERNQEWSNGDVFWEKDIHRGASEARSRINLSANLIAQGKQQQSIQNLLSVLDERGGLRSERGYSQFTRGDINKMRLLLGESYFLSGQYTKAELVLQNLVKLNGSTEARYYLWMSRLSSNPERDITDALNKIKSQESFPFYSCLLDAQYQYLQQQYDQTFLILKTCSDSLPPGHLLERNTLLMYQANAKLSEKDFQAARDIYREIVSSDSENLTAWSQLYRMAKNASDEQNAERIRRFLESKGYKIE